MKKGNDLYFIAVVPPEPERTRLWNLKEEFSEKYETKAALRSPPHITLHMPFQFRRDREERLISILDEFFSQYSKFQTCLKDFGAFPPRVIYADVEESEALLIIQSDLVNEMKVKLNIFNANYKDRPFRPHLTLAFRDLKKPMFETAWENYKERKLSICWETESITFLRHNGKHWEIIRELLLEGP